MPIPWRTARSLIRLHDQCNDAWPDRDRASDGTIGDAEHASRDSDHNPWYGPGIVTAEDITHDPAHGADMHRLAAAMVASRDRRVKFLVWNRRICSGAAGPAPWVWRPYTGKSPHTEHLHLSVVASPLCDDTSPWSLPHTGATRPGTPTTEEDDMTPEQATQLADVHRWLQAVGQSGAHTEQIAAGVANRQVLADAADAARDAALAQAVAQLAARPAGETGPLNMAAVRLAAEQGAADALARLQLSVSPDA